MRLMGWVAKTNHGMSRHSVNFVPSNWLVIFVTGIFGVGGIAIFFDEGNVNGLLWGIPCLLVMLAFLVSFAKRDTFFLAGSLPAVAPAVGDTALEAPLRWTGRLRLHEKTAGRFIDMPAMATRLDDGAFAVASNIDASTRFYGVVTSAKVGVWLAVPKPNSFEIEGGNFYYGFRGSPALRMKFVDGTDEKKSTAILAFDSLEARDTFSSWLSAEKSKVGGQAISSPQPQSNPDSPFSSSTQSA